MNETHEAVMEEARLLQEERLTWGVPETIVEIGLEAGELLNEEWAAEFDRRLAAWQADSPRVTEASATKSE